MNLNNLSLLKMIIRMLVIMIFFVIIFLISALLYSSRYWPDVYNYINANITIKRIPTIAELNITIIEVEYTTENTFVTDYTYSSTVDEFDFNIDEFTQIEDLLQDGNEKDGKRKRDIPIESFDTDVFGLLSKTKLEEDRNGKDEKRKRRDIQDGKGKRDIPIESFNTDIVELPSKSVVDYLFIEDTTVVNGFVETKIVKDLIDESKLIPKNVGDVEIMDHLNEIPSGELISSCHGKTSGVKQTFPWIATIFIKESPGNQYNYYCDGALVNGNHLITAARCMQDSNSTIKPEDVLVFLGKRSLQAVGDNEKTVKITKILTHENFTSNDGIFENDLAILTLEETVTPNDVIRPACLDEEGGSVDQSATTAWTVTGDLTPVYFIDKKSGCDGEGKNIICATYGNEVPLCPNYGGIYIIRRSKLWYLRGIRTGDPTDRGICFNKNVQYTNLENYQDWIVSNINSK